MAGRIPIHYPNMVEQISALAITHADIHTQVKNHAQAHAEALRVKRRQLQLQQAAKEALKKDEIS